MPYGPAQAPTYDETGAAATAGLIASDAVTFRSTTDSTVEEQTGGSVIALPDTVAGQLMAPVTAQPVTSSGLAAVGASRDALVAVAPAGAALTGFDDPSCVTITATRITYASCALTANLGDTISVNGYIARDGGPLSWDVTMVLHSSDVTFAMDVSTRMHGALTVTEAALVGQARSDVQATMTASGVNMVMGYSTIANVDLGYVASPFCITSGTLEVKRTWTQRPPGMPAMDPYADVGYLFTWNGCDAVNVAHSL